MSVTEQIQAELLTLSEAARLCGVGARSLWRWSHSGRAPKPLKITPGRRGCVRYRRADLLEWIQSGCEPVEYGKGES